MRFELQDAEVFHRSGLTVSVYNSREDFPHLSAALLDLTAQHGRAKSLISDRIYLILEGTGEFEVGAETFEVHPLDVVIVPRGTPYNCSGNLRVFMVHAPAFDAHFEVKLETSP